MSIQTTLDALKYHLQQALPGVNVQSEPYSIPYQGTLPALIVTEYEDYTERLFAGAGVKGNDPNRPNVYSFVYLQKPAKEQGKTLPTVVKALRADLERIKARFSHTDAQGLMMAGVPQALMAGEQIVIQYDRQGPFISYLEQLFIGAYGLISVAENVRLDTSP